MPEFKKGQLVAVKYGISWEPRSFYREDDEGVWCMDFLSHGISPCPSGCVKPAEDVWPGIFLEGHRRDELVYRQALDTAHDQIKWLCGQLNRLSQDTGHCLLPAGAGIPSDDSCRVGGCEICWEQASLKAVEGGDGD